MENTTDTQTEFQKAYNDLNESKKALLRVGFQEEHGYKSFDTFYKKMRGSDNCEFYPNEKKWLATQMNSTVEIIFPNK